MEEVVVYRTWDEPMAQMALGLLLAEGFDAVKRDSGLRSSIAITVDGLGEIEIRVPEDQAESAIDLIEARFSDTEESDVLEEDTDEDADTEQE